ncbi:flavin reductase family protein [Leucobacter chromiireducens]|uniref:flavin reductase family protein n=1 Tax=Leucobacter chromiireducens TaxID=283877 RepID=UPI000F638A69|nr:flavin reductase family protein [Leucobacter chromiireducens]
MSLTQTAASVRTEGAAMNTIVDSDAFDPRDLRSAFGQFATGVTVVTTVTPDGERIGVTANSFTSLSMDPPLVLWCPGRHLRSLPAFETASHFAINVLANDQQHLSRQFATGASDKFDGVALREGLAGLPVLEGTLATFECETVARHEAGDHVIYIGQIRQYAHAAAAPLVFHGGSYHDTTTQSTEAS